MEQTFSHTVMQNLCILSQICEKKDNFVVESGKVGGTFKENEKLKKEVRRLEEENNLLKLKFDVLLDMVICLCCIF